MIRTATPLKRGSSLKRGPYVHRQYWDHDSKYWHINGLGNTYNRWQTEGTRNAHPEDYTLEMFEILQDSEQFHYLVEYIYSMSPSDRIQIMAGDDLDVYSHPMCWNIPH